MQVPLATEASTTTALLSQSAGGGANNALALARTHTFKTYNSGSHGHINLINPRLTHDPSSATSKTVATQATRKSSANTQTSETGKNSNAKVSTKSTISNRPALCLDHKCQMRTQSVSEGAWRRSLRVIDPPERLLPAIPNHSARGIKKYSTKRAKSVERLGTFFVHNSRSSNLASLHLNTRRVKVLVVINTSDI